MTKDYFKRLTVIRYTAWDLNCRMFIPHTPARNRTENAIRKHARRKDKEFLRRGIDILNPMQYNRFIKKKER